MCKMGWICVGLVWAMGCGGQASVPGQPPVDNTEIKDDRPEATTGHLLVRYGFIGEESIDRIGLYLFDGEGGLACADTPLDLDSPSMRKERRNLPVAGEMSLSNLDPSDDWLIWAVGANGVGVPIADGCLENIEVEAGKTTRVDLTLQNSPISIGGQYRAETELNLELPADFLSTLFVVELACTATGSDSAACDIANELSRTFADLDVTVRWDVTQNGEFIRADMEWTEVEGVAVGPEWDLVSGGFSAQIPGATKMAVTSADLEIHVDELARFIVAEVMEVDLRAFGSDPEGLMGSLSTEIHSVHGSAYGVDHTFDGIAEVFGGDLDMRMEIAAFDHERDVTFDWVGERTTD